MKMKKSMQIMALLLVVFSVLSLTACKKYHMSEEEIKEACISEAEYFVGGYLRNDGPDFLEKYDPFPEQEYESKKLEDNYTWDLTDLAYRGCVAKRKFCGTSFFTLNSKTNPVCGTSAAFWACKSHARVCKPICEKSLTLPTADAVALLLPLL